MQKRKIVFAFMALLLAVVNCNLPSTKVTGVTDEFAATQTAFALTLQVAGGAPGQELINPAKTETPSPTPQPTATQCTGTVTANSNVNIRTGPGTVYDIVGYLPQGGNAPLAGKNNDGTWWYIQFPSGPGGYGWMSGSVSTAACVPASLAVIAAPPTPTSPPPTFTPTVEFHLLIPMLPIHPLPIASSDIKLQDVFLSTGGEILARVAVDPSGSLSGNVTYKVWVDGALVATRTEALPTGSILYWSGQTISGTHTVKVKVDTPNAYTESNEDNNVIEVTLTH